MRHLVDVELARDRGELGRDGEVLRVQRRRGDQREHLQSKARRYTVNVTRYTSHDTRYKVVEAVSGSTVSYGSSLRTSGAMCDSVLPYPLTTTRDFVERVLPAARTRARPCSATGRVRANVTTFARRRVNGQVHSRAGNDPQPTAECIWRMPWV